ncbi:uncharacterized protein LOC122647921 [Telopea speciosissima]|uniref:uncharacterized protein LOC122647921 n=1 Tax=Telopea speciosissima TaxID=54955 RepID=UPI001CC789C9|nr:uncharacterized protein LOC122647921 [Telopea speciosissima]
MATIAFNSLACSYNRRHSSSSSSRSVMSWLQGTQRLSLWDDLRNIAGLIGPFPWGIGGDFNVIRFGFEKQGGDHLDLDSMAAFNDCIEDLGMDDLRWTDPTFFWSNKRAGSSRIDCKLDRVIVNENWLASFPSSYAIFDTHGISDNSPISLSIHPYNSFAPKPFKYFDMWSSHPTFLTTVKDAWDKPVQAFSSPLIPFTRKLRNVKSTLKVWNINSFGNISQHVQECKDKFAAIQLQIQSDNLNCQLTAALELSLLLSQEESFLRQKSRIKWLELGDSNSAYFHRSMKSRSNFNSILQLVALDGSPVTNVKDIKDMAVNYFKDLFTGSLDAAD